MDYSCSGGSHRGCAVQRGNDIIAVVTRIDLVNFWDDPGNQEFEQEVAAAGKV